MFQVSVLSHLQAMQTAINFHYTLNGRKEMKRVSNGPKISAKRTGEQENFGNDKMNGN